MSRPSLVKKTEMWVLPDGIELHHVHSGDACVAPCVLHSPTPHSMADWPLHWRGDRGIFERICEHGIGHPDPDDFNAMHDGGVHGCDGCCR